MVSRMAHRGLSVPISSLTSLKTKELLIEVGRGMTEGSFLAAPLDCKITFMKYPKTYKQFL
jgi:hypothetical protein